MSTAPLTIRSRARGRIRFGIDALRRNPELGASLEHAFAAHPGVKSVQANPRTGSLLLTFSSEHVSSTWDAVFARALGVVGPTTVQAAARGTQRFMGALERLSASRRPRAGARAAHAAPVVRSHPAAATAPGAINDEEPWHELTVAAISERLGVSGAEGLTRDAAARRLASAGPNDLLAARSRGELRIMLDQLANTPVAMLGVSAVLSAATGGVADAIAIVSVLGINAVLGYAIESGAERTIAALTHTPQAAVPVLRDAVACQVSVSEIVCGDVLDLRAGIFVAADARVIASQDLTLDESALTGESSPVAKVTGPLGVGPIPLAERVDMVWRGTLVTGGSGRALVVATGMSTQIGRIQALASSVEARLTPLQKQLDKLGQQLAIGAGLACAATAVVGLLRGHALLAMFRTAVSLGVAAVPEGLPTVSIITLALGLKRMRREHVIVRQLAAVETLGAVQVVCLDKTGTLTVNRMTVVAAQVSLEPLTVSHDLLSAARTRGAPRVSGDFDALLRIAVLCNETELVARGPETVLNGSSTESALIELALAAGYDVRGERARHPLLSTQRRALERNYMSTRHAAGSGELLAVKGQPNEVLAMCSSCLREGQVLPLGEAERACVERENERFAARALRVLGFAYREGPARPDAAPEELVWIGLTGMEDAPRRGVSEVIARFHAAGVRTIMITGDQSATAQAVGAQVGISAGDGLETVDATRLDRIEPDVLRTLAQRADIFSRVSPAHKLQIVEALQAAGNVVAMTGDGVNDGPALKAADIGIAMGAGGTNAAREMADVVLEDDELRTLIVAIEQGRAIYDDIRKAVHFILSTNLTEILYTFTCVASGLGEPLTPLQLLWINLVTDVFPELALAAQPAESNVLARPPRDPGRPMFTKTDLLNIGTEGVVMTLGALSAYLVTVRRSGPGPRASTVGFTAITLAQLLHGISARSETHTIFDRETLAPNHWLTLALGTTALAQLATNVVPGLRTLLGTVPLGAADWSAALGGALGPFLVNETLKLLRRSANQLADRRAASALLLSAE